MEPTSVRRFKTLAEAVRMGCQRYPLQQTRRADPPGGRFGRGALQAAWLAQFPDATNPRDAVSAELLPYYPELRDDYGDSCPYGPNTSCPAWPRREQRTLEQAVIHLEDVHHLTREQIIRWLDAHGF